jgi:hypothetical protein
LGKDFGVGYHTKEFMEEVGFINVVEKKFKLPIGKWPAEPQIKGAGHMVPRIFRGWNGRLRDGTPDSCSGGTFLSNLYIDIVWGVAG